MVYKTDIGLGWLYDAIETVVRSMTVMRKGSYSVYSPYPHQDSGLLIVMSDEAVDEQAFWLLVNDPKSVMVWFNIERDIVEVLFLNPVYRHSLMSGSTLKDILKREHAYGMETLSCKYSITL